MKKILVFLLGALLGGFISFGAVAAGSAQSGDTSATGGDSMAWTVLVPELYDNQYVAGTIIRLDRKTGMVGLRTDFQGDLNLQFKPAALKKLKAGDIAVVFLGFSIDDRTISAESCDMLPVKVTNC